MSNAAPSVNDSEPSSGRDSKGRFLRGNPGGVGNPCARKVAQLRSALIERVTEQDIKDIAEVLILQARTGDHAAIKLLFQYVLGKPAPAADPDTVEIEEFQKIYAPQREIMEQFPQTIHSIPPGMVCAVTRIINEICVGQLRSMLETNSKPECRNTKQTRNPNIETHRQEHAEAAGAVGEAKPVDSRPSTHGGNGTREPGERARRPSTNGADGGRERLGSAGTGPRQPAVDIMALVQSALSVPGAAGALGDLLRPSPNGHARAA